MKSCLPQLKLANKRVFLRIDGNVPLSKDGEIKNLFRLQCIRPTLDYMLIRNTQVILLTHIGRPKNKEPHLSTKIIADWFSSIGYDTVFAQTIADAQNIPFKAQQIIMLENLRFFDGEKTNNKTFAQKLATLGEYYVTDAFGAMHRHDTSITLLPKQFKKNKKTIGFLIEEELEQLQRLQKQKPFLALIGGGKIETKLPLLAHLTQYADTIIPLPALSFSFEQARGNPIGISLVHEKAQTICSTITKLAEKYHTNIILPIDYQVADKTIEGTRSHKTITKFSKNDIGIAIGPKTLSLIKNEINSTKSIFFNGVMGFADIPKTQESSKELLSFIAQSNAYSVIAGGDTIACAEALGIIHAFNFVSTGGGAALQYIAGEKLPGLEVMKE